MAIASGASFPGYIVAIIIIGLGTGGIKANVSPLVAEQYRSKTPYIKTLKNGDRVIVSPQATYQKIFNYFYWVRPTSYLHLRCMLTTLLHNDRVSTLVLCLLLPPPNWKRTLAFGLPFYFLH